MLEGFSVIKDRVTLWVRRDRMLIIHKKLLEKKSLTQEEERDLKLYLFADLGPGRTFEDDAHRLRLVEQWLKEAEIHKKNLKRQDVKS